MTRALLVVLILTLVGISRVHADVAQVLNYGRFHGCGAPSTGSAMTLNPKLRRAAIAVARGASLSQALQRADYVAVRSTALHLAGVNDDAQVSRLLLQRYCRTLQEATLREFGAEQRGAEIWIVLAAPAALVTKLDATAVQVQILLLVNQARAAGRRCGAKYFAPVAKLQLEQSLTQAALAHSQDMAAHQRFDHVGGDGSTPAERIERSGYREHRLVGENIAAGAMSPAEVTQGWLASPGHCENIMEPRFSETGIAFADNPASAERIFWTQDFATRH